MKSYSDFLIHKGRGQKDFFGKSGTMGLKRDRSIMDLMIMVTEIFGKE